MTVNRIKVVVLGSARCGKSGKYFLSLFGLVHLINKKNNSDESFILFQTPVELIRLNNSSNECFRFLFGADGNRMPKLIISKGLRKGSLIYESCVERLLVL